MLLNELNHRVKNTLVTVQSFAVQSLRNAGSAAQGREALEGRPVSLARAHDVLTREHWELANVTDVVASALSPYFAKIPNHQLQYFGSETSLKPKAASRSRWCCMNLQRTRSNTVRSKREWKNQCRLASHLDRAATRPVHFTAPINAFNASSDGQQQRSTPLFGSALAAIDVDQHRPAGHWRAVEQIGTHAVIDDDRREKDLGLCRLRARRGESSASALVALSDVFAGGVVERRLLSGWSFQQRLEPCQ